VAQVNFPGVNIFAQKVIFGGLLIAALAVTIDRPKIRIIK
jgi:ribose transport system permease protein